MGAARFLQRVSVPSESTVMKGTCEAWADPASAAGRRSQTSSGGARRWSHTGRFGRWVKVVNVQTWLWLPRPWAIEPEKLLPGRSRLIDAPSRSTFAWPQNQDTAHAPPTAFRMVSYV